MSNKRVIFMGTPDFSATVLKTLAQSAYQVVMVVTQPDRPKGRGMHLGSSAVKQTAQQLGIETIYQPEKLRSAQVQAPILVCEADYIITAAFGQLLPDRILQHARVAAINLHASLLPAYRGSAPIHRAILNGERVTGVSTMLMTHALDAGDVLLQQSCVIEASDTVGSLYEKLAQIGANLLLETLDRYENNTITAHPQDESKVTYAAAITAADQKVNWQQSAQQIYNRIRGLNPEPGAFCLFRGKNLKLWQSSLAAETGADQPDANQPAAAQPGEILQADWQGLLVQCGSGRLRLTEIQPAGKNKMAAAAFIRGNKVTKGELLS
ncbi:MAG: methionyl-tRNA formyltransferase [Negativicutes bacterium]|nr:methionyl-tRNA formyltransferase [Negativicutes bacterium]